MATDTSQPEVDAQGVPVPVVGIQLTQVRVPLDEAAEALSTQDEAGRLPIVVLPKQAYRIRNGFVGAGLLLVLGGSCSTSRCRSVAGPSPPARS